MVTGIISNDEHSTCVCVRVFVTWSSSSSLNEIRILFFRWFLMDYDWKQYILFLFVEQKRILFFSYVLAFIWFIIIIIIWLIFDIPCGHLIWLITNRSNRYVCVCVCVDYYYYRINHDLTIWLSFSRDKV